jgi:hypothetical protein
MHPKFRKLVLASATVIAVAATTVALPGSAEARWGWRGGGWGWGWGGVGVGLGPAYSSLLLLVPTTAGTTATAIPLIATATAIPLIAMDILALTMDGTLATITPIVGPISICQLPVSLTVQRARYV